MNKVFLQNEPQSNIPRASYTPNGSVKITRIEGIRHKNVLKNNWNAIDFSHIVKD